MLNYLINIKTSWLLCLLLAVVLVTSCKKDEDNSPAVELLSFGPSPALRGGELRFIGKGLDKVTAIVLSDNVEVTSFNSKSAEQIVITIPTATVDGKVILKTPQGNIETKTILEISEPITITSMTPARVRPGAVVTIEGTYLNLVKEVVFANKKSVTTFQSQSQTKLEVKVPEDAQTGTILISNGATDPIVVESETALDIVLPAVTQLSPNPVKAGKELTIEGTDLDLTTAVTFSGGSKVSTFVSKEAGKLIVNVPSDSKDGTIKLVAASLVEVESANALTMVVPTLTEITPNPAKNGKDITLKGKDLDLITTVVFGGGKQGQIGTRSETEMTIKVPEDAKVDLITFNTAAGKSVSTTSALNLVKPKITSFAPMEIKANAMLTIEGADLDLVTKVIFGGEKEVTVSGASENKMTVTVPPGTLSGSFTLVAKNGDVVTSEQPLSILPSNIPNITNMPASIKPGQILTIEGEKLDLFVDVIFPGDVRATMFGVKSYNVLQVFVPLNVKKGFGTIKFITGDNEMTESPLINIQGVDAVVDPTLVFFNFDNLNRWWGDTGANENDPALSLDGTNYFHVNASLNGWSGFFWRNGKNDFPADRIGTDVANYVLKFDVNILEPITGGEFAWRLKGSAGDFWYYWKPWAASGSYKTDGWITVSIPLNQFEAGGTKLSDLSTISEDFGVAFNNGSSMVNALFDNIRFEKVN